MGTRNGDFGITLGLGALPSEPLVATAVDAVGLRRPTAGPGIAGLGSSARIVVALTAVTETDRRVVDIGVVGVIRGGHGELLLEVRT
jgi:hypothetical protein